MNNEHEGSKFGNLAKEFASAVRSRLINKNFFIRVAADDPDFAKEASKLTIMVNSVARTIDLKETLDDATEESLWASTGWIECGHTLDFHSFDPTRSVFYKGNNQFDVNELQDRYEPIPEEQVAADIGNELSNVGAFDPFQDPVIEDPKKPELTFDPDVGAPWVKTVSPFNIIIPRETKSFKDADYVSKLVLLSKQELAEITGEMLPDEVTVDLSLFQRLIDETPGGQYITKPVIVAVTYIRRDRNDPGYNSWYLAHVIGHPDVVIKNSVNPYGGMIPLVPAKSRKNMRILSKSWIEDMRPYTDNYARVIESTFSKILKSLNLKWSVGANTAVDKRNEKRIDDPDYNGQIKFENGDPESFGYLQQPGITQDDIQALNLISKLAQGEAGQTDIDRGTPIKKITARQTEALLNSSALAMEAIRGPVVEAGNEIILKIIHMLNLFSTPREHVFTFGPHVVKIEPGGNDFTTSYQYKISVRDLEGAAGAEEQVLFVQFMKQVATIPFFQQVYNWPELGNEGRRRFGMGMEVMNNLQVPGEGAGLPPGAGPGAPPELPGGPPGEEHPERALGSQGAPDMANALGGLV
tara:strand:- start:3247 stop:4992 length:1746 start_codon:yes stop_codon:yes gene_type:complete